MKQKLFYLLALFIFILVVLATPVYILSSSYEDVHKTSNVVVETDYFEIPTTLNKRDSKYILYLLKPIINNIVIFSKKFSIVLVFSCLIEYIILTNFCIIYPVGVNAPPYIFF